MVKDANPASDPAPGFTTTSQQLAAGRRQRRMVPRSTLSAFTEGNRDPLGIIAGQNATRVQKLVPLRIERMSQNAFTFYRGTAAIMAADLADDPNSGILVASCGDAHVANFGFYASPQRTLVFDLNDFDEAAWAPWEWDLKRLVTSIVIAGRTGGRDQRVTEDAALAAVRSYARTMSAASEVSPAERYFTHFDVRAAMDGMDRRSRLVLKQAIRDASKRTGNRAASRLTERDSSGAVRFVEQPPMMVRVGTHEEAVERVHGLMDDYQESTQVDIRILLRQYRVADMIRRVVGVGSVGTRCSLTALEDSGGGVLLLQSKEAGRSVLERYGRVPQPQEYRELVDAYGEGARVVALQRILQAVSDPFLGHLRDRQQNYDIYVRQFHDMKGGVDADALEDSPFGRYARACGAVLARAHAQSPRATEVAGYIGNGRVVSEAILEWSLAYAERSAADYESFVQAMSPVPAQVSQP